LRKVSRGQKVNAETMTSLLPAGGVIFSERGGGGDEAQLSPWRHHPEAETQSVVIAGQFA